MEEFCAQDPLFDCGTMLVASVVEEPGWHHLLPNDVVPITVVTAVVIFITKELFEGIRRFRVSNGQVKLYKSLIAEEIQKIKWRTKVGTELLENYKEEVCSEHNTIHLKDHGGGSFNISIRNTDTTLLLSGRSFSIPSSEKFQSLMLALCKERPKMLAQLSAVDRAITQAEHVLRSYVHHTQKIMSGGSEGEMYSDDGMAISFVDYGLRELSDCDAVLGKLFKEFTGEELEGNHRVR